jgi:hypothetical protein
LYTIYFRVLHIRVDNLAEGKLSVVSILYGEPFNHYFHVSQFNANLHHEADIDNNDDDDDDDD